MKATIKKIITETPRVLTFILEPEQPVSFITGQAMRWGLPGVTGGRLFSIASPGSEHATELWFTIRIFEDGRFTSHLRPLKVGDTVELTGPFGNFRYQEASTRDVGLIAGGSGISVLRSILLHVLAMKPPRKVHLVFSVLNKNEIIYEDELRELATEHPNFTYTIVLTEADPAWKGPCGFVTRPIFDAEFKNYAEDFYICGPKPFMDCAVGILHEAGVGDDRIFIDQWNFYPSQVKQTS